MEYSSENWLAFCREASMFFSGREQAMQIVSSFADQREHTLREWQLEYDYLFRGTDADFTPPLWASVCADERVLNNPRTLEVIKYYHRCGYTPIYQDSNPADYIGEQYRFLAYLAAAAQAGSDKDKNNEDAENFIQTYTLENIRLLQRETEKRNSFTGYLTYLKHLLLVTAGFEAPGRASSAALSEEAYFTQVCENGRFAPVETEPPRMINTAGWNNCGGKCVIRPTVQENCMLSIASDCSSNDPQIRACVRGRGYRKTFYSEDRLRYPMKRVGPRGSGRFERISWQEAADIIADNWKRIRRQYGPSAFYVNYATGVTGMLRPAILAGRLLSLDGGYLGSFNSYSSACSFYIARYIYGSADFGTSPADYLNTKLLIFWGDNSAETIFGSDRNYYLSLLRQKGVRVISIDPRNTQTSVAYADEWIPIRPCTDAALADAMAYVIWSEGLQDQTFMDKYCLGFDEAHMPPDVPKGLSYHSYLFGLQDGVIKTPEWAEKITGVPAATIRRLALEYAKARPANIIGGHGLQRVGNGEQNFRGICMLCALCGNIGVPGGSAGGSGMTKEHEMIGRIYAVKNPYSGAISCFLWTKAIEHGTELTPRADRLKGVERLDSNIKMIFNLAGNCLINQHSDINETMRILSDDTKCECIVGSDLFMTSSMRWCDIVLPATSGFESNNIVNPWRGSNYILRNNKATEPLFESRFEYEWLKEVAERLGLYEPFVEGRPDPEDWLREGYARMQAKEPELPDYDTFAAAGGWQYRQKKLQIPFAAQIQDIGRVPFPTPSGKIEIFSKRLYDFDQRADIPEIPKYVPCPEGPDDPLTARYPLQLIGWHTRRRCHSVHDNNEWQEEVEKPGLWINPEDAAQRGIADGAQVKIWNDRGVVIIPAVVTGRIMRGVVAMTQGGWFRPDEKGRDRRGSINVLTHLTPTPLAKGNPQHTNLVQVALWNEETEA